MKILYVTSLFYPNEPGGAEKQTKKIAENQLKTGKDVFVLSFDSLIESTFEEVNGIKVMRIYLKGISEFILNFIGNRKKIGKSSLIYILINPFNWIKIKKALLKIPFEDIDIIHISNNMNLLPSQKIIRYLAKLYPKAKKVISFHDFFFLGRRTKFPNKKIPLVAYNKKKFLEKEIDYLISPSDYVKEILVSDLNVPSNKIWKIYNSASKEINRTSEKDNKNPMVIMYAGAIDFYKGIDILVESFKSLYKEYGNKIQLLIIGQGNYLDETKKMLSSLPAESYKIHGWKSEVELLDFFKNADLFILPSRYNETFGMGLIESYFCGALPMGSKNGAIPEILNHDEDLLFDNIHELTSKIEKFIVHKELIKKKYDTLKEHMKNFLSSSVYKNYSEFYNYIIKV